MKKKSIKTSYRKKTAALITLTMFILATALCMQAKEVKAAVGDNHRVDAEYYGALIHNSHDPSRSGEWYFKITDATGA